METKDEHEKRKLEQTPIIDGDARPDINLNPEDDQDHPIEIPRERNKTTKNRADRNSLEDYKDAKEA